MTQAFGRFEKRGVVLRATAVLACSAAMLLSAFEVANAQVLKLCVHGNNNSVRAIPTDQDCDDIPGPFQEFTLSDGDWQGQGTGVLHLDGADDNVAIGQTDAASRLEVLGKTTGEDVLSVATPQPDGQALTVTGGADVVVGPQSGTNATLTVNARAEDEVARMRANGNTAFYVGRDGRTGIRTSQPLSALHVTPVAEEDPFRLNLHGSTQPQVRVTPNGDLGIGDPEPQDLLSVLNDGRSRAGFFRNTERSNNQAVLAATTVGNGAAVFGNILNRDSTNATVHAIHSGRGVAGRFDGQLSVTRNNHQIRIRDDDNAFKSWTLTSHQNSSGFGIWEDGEDARFLVEAGGDVGIGTLNPEVRLHVQGSNDGTDLLVQDSQFARMRMVATAPANDVTLTVQARGSANTRRAEIGTISNHDLVLFANGATRLLADSDGNVCIGNC